ncbi:hypothetical protein, partial [Salmonella enterica]|uniref:hypothetical protein n=1 Tax=Salmonella enterica TaxID=28901 RepID=UPI0021B264E1
MLYAVIQIKIEACFGTGSAVRIELKAVCVCNARRGKTFCAITKRGFCHWLCPRDRGLFMTEY